MAEEIRKQNQSYESIAREIQILLKEEKKALKEEDLNTANKISKQIAQYKELLKSKYNNLIDMDIENIENDEIRESLENERDTLIANSSYIFSSQNKPTYKHRNFIMRPFKEHRLDKKTAAIITAGVLVVSLLGTTIFGIGRKKQKEDNYNDNSASTTEEMTTPEETDSFVFEDDNNKYSFDEDDSELLDEKEDKETKKEKTSNNDEKENKNVTVSSSSMPTAKKVEKAKKATNKNKSEEKIVATKVSEKKTDSTKGKNKESVSKDTKKDTKKDTSKDTTKDTTKDTSKDNTSTTTENPGGVYYIDPETGDRTTEKPEPNYNLNDPIESDKKDETYYDLNGNVVSEEEANRSEEEANKPQETPEAEETNKDVVNEQPTQDNTTEETDSNVTIVEEEKQDYSYDDPIEEDTTQENTVEENTEEDTIEAQTISSVKKMYEEQLDYLKALKQEQESAKTLSLSNNM